MMGVSRYPQANEKHLHPVLADMHQRAAALAQPADGVERGDRMQPALSSALAFAVSGGGSGSARRGTKRGRGWEAASEGSGAIPEECTVPSTLTDMHHRAAALAQPADGDHRQPALSSALAFAGGGGTKRERGWEAASEGSGATPKKYTCGVCGQRFSQSGHMKAHERTHTGEEPYACGVCGQRFSVSGNMKAHERTHTGEKPFACSVCLQRFRESGRVKVHGRTHTGERPHAGP